jgi:mono/diheme cytochrome c family protein
MAKPLAAISTTTIKGITKGVGFCALVYVIGGNASYAAAGSSTAPVVPGIEQLHQADMGLSSHGELLLGELNCLSCHVPNNPKIAERITTKPAPDLSNIGLRVNPQWLSDYIKHPSQVKPGTTMPNVFHDVPESRRDESAEAITHFLISQSGQLESPEHGVANFDAKVHQGRELFHSVGCVACHNPENNNGKAQISSVPLPDLTVKTSVNALMQFLRNPQSIRHGGRMPSLDLNEREAERIAIYLLREQIAKQDGSGKNITSKQGMLVKYYEEERFNKLPDFSKLTPKAVDSSAVINADIPIKKRKDNVALQFTGMLDIKTAGTYKLEVNSDDGTKLFVDDQLIINNDGGHGNLNKTADLHLRKGPHSIEVQFYNGRGNYALGAHISGGDLKGRIPLADATYFQTAGLKTKGWKPFKVSATKAKQGKKLFASTGCASCHSLDGVTNSYQAKAFEDLKPNLSSHKIKYDFSEPQVSALKAVLSNTNALVKPREKSSEINHILATYNCFACHNRTVGNTKVGGPDQVRSEYFDVIGDLDLGDEGRLPPTLTGIGSKLNPTALASILKEKTYHVRSEYMATRMPQFFGEPIEALAPLLTAVDGNPTDLIDPPFTEQAMRDGHKLVGNRGVGCINCHNVGGNKSLGIPMVNLGTVHQRLQPGWLKRFLKNPGAYNKGTRMPAFWFNDTVINKTIADGTADAQLDALWSYLSLGDSMPIPEGMSVGNSMVLQPVKEPVIFRTFMKDVSPRTITVGYPESMHIAFDANNVRLAKAWRGSFFDAKGTWAARAGQFFDPLGKQVIDLPPGPSIAVLKNKKSPWPKAEQGMRNVGGTFNGYQYDEQRRPIFNYRLGDIHIAEQALPKVSKGGANMIRSFTLKSAKAENSLYLLLAQGKKIKLDDQSPNQWIVDGSQKIRLLNSQSSKAIVRRSEGVQQLLLPISLKSNKAVSLELELLW